MAHVPYSLCHFALRYVDTVLHSINPVHSPVTIHTETRAEAITVTKPSSSLLLDSHCSTLRRKVDYIDTKELKGILDDLGRELRYESKRSIVYINALNQAVDSLNGVRHSVLSTVASHKFFISIRNVTRDLLIDWHSTHQLNSDETFLLRNCVLLLSRLVHAVDKVFLLTTWLPNPSFVNAIANCMSDIDRLLDNDKQKYNFKQLTRLLNMFSEYYKRLSSKLQNDNEFDRLFIATMDCLTSTRYDRAFRNLKNNAESMTTEQKFFLVKCPAFLTLCRGSRSSQIMEQLLEIMVPRYASLLDKHIRSMSTWRRSMMHAVHHLLLTVAHAEGYYTPYANGQPLRWLVDHIIRILGEPVIIAKVNEKQTSPETMLIDSALNALGAFVHEPDLLAYIKQLKVTSTFRSLILVPYESIVFRAYVMLSYAMDEDEIKASEKDSGRLLSNIFDSLRKGMRSLAEISANEELSLATTNNNIALLTEAIQVLVQHDQIKSEILKQHALSLLINSSQQFQDRSKRLILESLGSMTFDHEAAQMLRKNASFLKSIENMQKTTDDGIQKAAEKIYWNLIKEPEYLEKMIEKEKDKRNEEKTKEKEQPNEEIIESDGKKPTKPQKQDFKHEVMISYCHADKEIVYRIHKFLSDQGFNIWFDRDNIYGPAMQAMADAVENSEFVIVCMSDSYKRSIYCQAEAEYAFNCRRRLLPIIVRQGYKADGWLGLLMGSRIYVDFGRDEFKKACTLLINQIILQRKNEFDVSAVNGHNIEDEPRRMRLKSISNIIPLTPTAHAATDLTHLPEEYTNRDTIESTYGTTSLNIWTRKDVLDFLFDHNLHHMMPLCELMTGQGLKKLFRLCQKKPNRFYSQLNEELHLRYDGFNLPIGIFTQFMSEMERLTGLLSDTPTQSDESVVNTPIPAPSSQLLPRTSVKSIITQPNFVPLLQPPMSLPSQITSIPISRQEASPASMMTQTSPNVQVTEQTTYQSQSFVGPSNGFMVQPLPASQSVLPKQVVNYESEPLSIDRKAPQQSHINTVPYKRTSYAYGTKFVREIYFPRTNS